ncbi:MAG: flavodoxin family protein [Actinomycetes bacterium]
MPTLLVVQHTPSPAVQDMLEAVLRGAEHPELGPIDVEVRAALACGADDVLTADAVILGTPANIGYMSGALKHCFDTIYYPCLQVTGGKPYGVFVHGNDDTSGALRSIHKIAGGMSWKQAAEDVSVTGPPSRQDLAACEDLGALLGFAATART